MLIPKGDKSNLNTLEPGCCFSLLVVLHGFDDRCPSMESYFRPPLFEHQRRSRTNGISKLSVRSWSRTFRKFSSSPGCVVEVLGSKFGGTKPEKLGFHLASCNMQLLANYTEYYTVAIFTRNSLIYICF